MVELLDPCHEAIGDCNSLNMTTLKIMFMMDMMSMSSLYLPASMNGLVRVVHYCILSQVVSGTSNTNCLFEGIEQSAPTRCGKHLQPPAQHTV